MKGRSSFNISSIKNATQVSGGGSENEGISVPIAVIFLSGLTAGVGILALPYSVNLVSKYICSICLRKSFAWHFFMRSVELLKNA